MSETQTATKTEVKPLNPTDQAVASFGVLSMILGPRTFFELRKMLQQRRGWNGQFIDLDTITELLTEHMSNTLSPDAYSKANSVSGHTRFAEHGLEFPPEYLRHISGKDGEYAMEYLDGTVPDGIDLAKQVAGKKAPKNRK